MQVEVCLQPHSAATHAELADRVNDLVRAAGPVFEGQQLDLSADPALAEHVRRVKICEVPGDAMEAGASAPTLYVHQLFDEEAEEEAADDSDASGPMAFQMWTLPAQEFDGLWVRRVLRPPADRTRRAHRARLTMSASPPPTPLQLTEPVAAPLQESLLYEDEVKPRLLRYVSSAMKFSELGVDDRILSWNRVVLLHGPPGTGKTSLCKGLSQKLAIRMSHAYANGHLIEVNAHSLFSKWFSESGKMVMSMFAKIREILEDGEAFVCILIDEVESLTAARQSAISGSEPSDAVRVVNALLTQLDQLRRYRNALVLTTSNLTGAIDAAFIDRADIKQYIGPPGVVARYQILSSCVQELCRASVLAPFDALLRLEQLAPLLPSPLPAFELLQTLNLGAPSELATKHSMMLHAIAAMCAVT